MMRRILTVSGLVLAVMAPRAPVGAQSGSSAARLSVDSVPREYQPPANMCRIWLDGVPAAQQPAPTECSVAVRTKPPNGRVVYGPTKSGGTPRGASDLPIKRFDGKAGAASSPIRLPGRPDVSDTGRPPWESKRITDDQLLSDRQGALPVSSSSGQAGDAGSMGGFDAYVGQGGGLLLSAGPITDPRYFAQAAPPPGRGSSNCLDRDGDGWCDDFRFGPPPCLDQDRDGRCDDLPAFAALPFP